MDVCVWCGKDHDRELEEIQDATNAMVERARLVALLGEE
jgi:hypothetical protein